MKGRRRYRRVISNKNNNNLVNFAPRRPRLCSEREYVSVCLGLWNKGLSRQTRDLSVSLSISLYWHIWSRAHPLKNHAQWLQCTPVFAILHFYPFSLFFLFSPCFFFSLDYSLFTSIVICQTHTFPLFHFFFLCEILQSRWPKSSLR